MKRDDGRKGDLGERVLEIRCVKVGALLFDLYRQWRRIDAVSFSFCGSYYEIRLPSSYTELLTLLWYLTLYSRVEPH